MAKDPSAETPMTFQRRPENLAYIFQEVLTAIVRLRSGRQSVADDQSFRAHIKGALQTASQQAQRSGYSSDVTNRAVFAAVVFIDESVLNLKNAAFVEWMRKPLAEELFNDTWGGKVFFEDLRRLLAQQDSAELADLLELDLLCILLGFRGEFGTGAHGQLREVIQSTTDKLRRIRGSRSDLSPSWTPPPQDVHAPAPDPWGRRWVLIFGATAVLALVLFVSFSFSLADGVSKLSSVATDTKK